MNMDAQVITNNLKKQDKFPVRVMTIDVKEFVESVPILADKGTSLEPTTPIHNRENVDFPIDSPSPPISVCSLPDMILESLHCGDDFLDSVDCSPRTPKEGMFNPFAPGPDDMVLAPLCKKYFSESRFSVARRLNFDSSHSDHMVDGNCGDEVDTQSDDGVLLKSFYDSLLEFVVSMQMGGVVAEILPPPSKLDFDGCKTPTSAPLLTGIAETCPDAPRKKTGKLLNIDMGLCRKLEF